MINDEYEKRLAEKILLGALGVVRTDAGNPSRTQKYLEMYAEVIAEEFKAFKRCVIAEAKKK